MEDNELQGKLVELIEDENQIVTCKLFSQRCNVDMQKSKKIMDDFSKGDNFSRDFKVCCLLTGFETVNEVKVYKMVVTNSDDIDGAKSKLKPMMSCSVFSIQKKHLKDYSALYTPEIDLQTPLITNKSIVIRTANIPKSEIKSEKQAEKPKPVIVSKPKTADKNPLATAFGKTAPEKKSPDATKATAASGKASTAGGKAAAAKKSQPNKSNSISQAFAKQASTTVKKISPPPKVKEEPESKKKIVKVEAASKSKKKAAKAPSPEPVIRKRDILSSSEEEQEEIIAKVKKPTKKMRRIIQMSDSESDQEMPDADSKSKENKSDAENGSALISDDEVESSPKEPLSDTVNVQSKHMEYRTVTSTYQDEEGFFVTKQEKKLVEVTEEPESSPPAPAPQQQKNSKPIENKSSKSEKSKAKKTSAKPEPQAKKQQTSISSFFKRKV